jgi:hypothetical protein
MDFFELAGRLVSETANSQRMGAALTHQDDLDAPDLLVEPSLTIPATDQPSGEVPPTVQSISRVSPNTAQNGATIGRPQSRLARLDRSGFDLIDINAEVFVQVQELFVMCDHSNIWRKIGAIDCFGRSAFVRNMADARGAS